MHINVNNTMTFDVIIVGGRAAGSTLATRLGAIGLSVLLLERATLPSLPAASSPIIYAPAMALLDEIGATEQAYAHNTPRIRRWIIEADSFFTVQQPIPPAHGRDYAYAIDRARFDAALWDHAAAQPSVDARQHHAVTDLLWDDNHVIGVRAKNTITQQAQTFRARLVVGADGRFSTVARKAGAQPYDEHTHEPTSLYYAYWRGVQPFDGGAPAAHMLSTGGDYGLLLMDSADNTTAVVIEGCADIVTPPQGGAEAFYEDFLREHPALWARLKHAERMTPVRGMKRVGNCYRAAGGAGWALVGDAIHQKDPLDGQGIYDALFTAKALANVIRQWCEGDINWQTALTRYEQTVRAETLPMYRATLARVHREIYTRRPAWFMHTVARWLYEDEAYRRHWARLFIRQTPPESWFSYWRVLMPVLRGIWRDISRKPKQFPHPFRSFSRYN